jgi:hypothetical protein
MTRKSRDGGYDIGYGRPPPTKRFKPGQSGNPRGRPSKTGQGLALASGDHDRMIVAEANRHIKVMTNGREETLSVEQALQRQLGMKGLKGDTGAAKSFLNNADRAHKRIDAEWATFEGILLDYQARWSWEKEYRALERPPRPEPAPHPSEIVSDRDRDCVLFNGPKTDEEAELWRQCRSRVVDIDRLLERLDEAMDASSSHNRLEVRHSLKAERDLIDAMFPAEATRRSTGFDLDIWRLEHLSQLVKSKPPERFVEPIHASGILKTLRRRVGRSNRRDRR